MNIYYLYVKTHKKTGLKYLGYTRQNPFTYSGSGTDWKSHLKTHGYKIHTDILFQSSIKKEVIQLGIFYSNLWNILTAADNFGDKIWANKILETGSGEGRKSGTHMSKESIELIRTKATGRKQSSDTIEKRSKAMIERFKTHSQWNKNVLLSSIYTKDELSVKYGRTGEKNNSYGKPVPKKECPHCGKNVDIRNFARSHGDRCKAA